MRLSAEEVELLMHRGMKYLQAEMQADGSDPDLLATGLDLPQTDNSRRPPKSNRPRGPGR